MNLKTKNSQSKNGDNIDSITVNLEFEDSLENLLKVKPVENKDLTKRKTKENRQS
jgi:hypothetical protein